MLSFIQLIDNGNEVCGVTPKVITDPDLLEIPCAKKLLGLYVTMQRIEPVGDYWDIAELAFE